MTILNFSAPRHWRCVLQVALSCACLASCPIVAQSQAPTPTGEQILRAMHDRYAGKWYHTVTLNQKTTIWRTDTTVVEMWTVAFSLPGRMREEAHHGNGSVMTYIMSNDSTYRHFMPGDSAKRMHAGNYLLTISYDVYAQPVEHTIADLRDAHFNLAPVHEDTFEGRPVYVIGAAAGDAHSLQLWIDKERLMYVRTLTPDPRDTSKTLDLRTEEVVAGPNGTWFNLRNDSYGGDGKLRIREENTDVKFNPPLDPQLFAIPPAR